MRIMIAVIALMVVSVLSIAAMPSSGDGMGENGGHLQSTVRQTTPN
ncbi:MULTISPECIES: hypothetical protein [unclassified Rhizobium]|nr:MULTISPECIES: hypothetical protein [unclassified Rhizobium]MBO9123461.1 hypothetical protein [Rhizobium sp. 16-488-2b]MBO9173993.1 hypothetical protein [Rhizobium sp. 16-488-2a]MDM9648544.1 hypothetical protein [Rhizobium sp. S163]